MRTRDQSGGTRGQQGEPANDRRRRPLRQWAAQALEPRRLLASIVVNSDADNATPGDGLVTLREAITAANATAGADTITFDFGPGARAINLTSALPEVFTKMDIRGPGPELLAVRRDSGGSYRIFTNTGAEVGLSGITIANGQYGGFSILDGGGGVRNNGGVLTLSNCVLTGNEAFFSGGGIFNNHGTLTVTDCTISGNIGGGIFNERGTATVTSSTISGNTRSGITNSYGALTVIRSTLSHNIADVVFIDGIGGGIRNDFGTMLVRETMIGGNTAHEGGGIANRGTATIVDSTISRNSAVLDSFGIAGHGGGIVNISRLVAENCTIADNTAVNFGGGIHGYGASALRNSTVTGNSAGIRGGGIFDEGALVPGSTFIVSNSIVALNRAPADSDLSGGPFTGSFNFIGGDPKLAPLADNGGPTMTMALLPGSPAINAGDPAFAPPPLFDQRGPGFPRVMFGRIDIGAYEVRSPVVMVEHLMARVGELKDAAVISKGRATAMANPLEQALHELARSRPSPAARQLEVFVNQLEGAIAALDVDAPGYAAHLDALTTLKTGAQSIVEQLLAAAA